MASSPNIFLNPKSVNGLMYLAFMIPNGLMDQIYKKGRSTVFYNLFISSWVNPVDCMIISIEMPSFFKDLAVSIFP